MSTSTFADAADRLVRIGQRFDARGWVLGTSGNFSVVLDEEPLRLAITRSGTHKGELTASDILEVGDDGGSIGTAVGRAVGGDAAAPRDRRVRGRPAAVMHTHSIWSTLLSDRFAARGGVAIQGYEMLKGLAGVTTHEHREWIPILDNDQDMARLAAKVGATLRDRPRLPRLPAPAPRVVHLGSHAAGGRPARGDHRVPARKLSAARRQRPWRS